MSIKGAIGRSVRSLIGDYRPAFLRKDPFARYRAAARTLGFNAPTLLLSFDCDTDWDIDVVARLDGFLTERGIAATYAVPGAQLRKGRETYARLAARGAEFMNHGACAHAQWHDDRYHPITFYDRISAQDVVDDIEQGHEIVREITATAPIGFRAPHFGSFQSDDDLALIYRTIGALGYRYASTTIPARGLANGPAYRVAGIIEFPTFGSWSAPTTILDSWTYLTDRRHYALGEEYFVRFSETLDAVSRTGTPALLTWYADPSHVWQQAPFMKAMDLIAERNIPSLRGRDLVESVAPKLSA